MSTLAGLLNAVSSSTSCKIVLRLITGIYVNADVMNRKPRLAWELYLKMETSTESYSILQIIANDCYKVQWIDK